MRKNRKVFVVALVIMLVAAAVPAFAAEPMAISGVWELVESDGSKVYYYFSPGAASGTAVGVGVVPGVVEQTFPIHGNLRKKTGNNYFACIK